MLSVSYSSLPCFRPGVSHDAGYLGGRISFLWKGYHLEHRFGWLRFALTIAYLLVVCHVLVVVLAFSLETCVGLRGYSRQCSIGFSGVLFALKVLLNHGSPAFTNVYGFRVPTKYAAWLELVYIHLLVPRTSFIGHMCGILAGAFTQPRMTTS
jgi:rhomboid domain-containing protein 1